MRHINIPIFIPHLGCPNQCIFCNQRHISGTVQFEISSVKSSVDETLSTVKSGDECEIAFFGGSFTGIDRDLMVALLDIAEEYVKAGSVVGIRMSTRPDYISQEIIDILKGYTITLVELGIQSMNDRVLTYLKRGHTVADTVRAAELLNSNGIPFVGQMMVGLPKSTKEDEIHCAVQICKLGAVAARIYPTIVFCQTELADLTKSGEYVALTLDEAVERSASVLRVFNDNNVCCIRIGLSDSENLHSSKTYVAGPNSPSIGEMVKSRLILDKIIESVDKELNRFEPDLKDKILHIECKEGLVSQTIGHKRKNLVELKNKYGFRDIKVFGNPGLDFETKIELKN